MWRWKVKPINLGFIKGAKLLCLVGGWLSNYMFFEWKAIHEGGHCSVTLCDKGMVGEVGKRQSWDLEIRIIDKRGKKIEEWERKIV